MQAQHIVERRDLPDDTERPIERDEAVLERENSNALGVGLDVTEVPNMPVDVRRRAMRHFEWIEVRTSRRATVAQVARGTRDMLRRCRSATGDARHSLNVEAMLRGRVQVLDFARDSDRRGGG